MLRARSSPIANRRCEHKVKQPARFLGYAPKRKANHRPLFAKIQETVDPSLAWAQTPSIDSRPVFQSAMKRSDGRA